MYKQTPRIWAAKYGHLPRSAVVACSIVKKDVRGIRHGSGPRQMDIYQWFNGCMLIATKVVLHMAMNWAAENGHLPVVQWLHANRQEGCTTLAINWAAKNGHLDIVQWLKENVTMFRNMTDE